MPSIIEGYNYDIFISYRQNDNKYDGWVTEFVDNLNKELEATIKDKISVYFDINPHDGLLETHSVDRSLEEKLKCLIFIPVISQTYCDSKSFAWQHEFCAFNKLAKEDKFGRDINLIGGNVASRILPVKIHDLDPDDKVLLENELGGVLRSVEFIYKSAGVNRPLRANEDHPQDNLNKTYYRDQINKVANAVKEIINAFKKQCQHTEEVSKQGSESKPAPQKNLITKIILGTLISLALIMLGYFFIPKLSKSSEQLEKTIAVLPFHNLSNDSTQLWFCDGVVEDIRNNLQKVKSFTVRSKPSSDQYRDTKKSTKTIGNEINVNYLVGGSVGREGDNIKIWVYLSDSKADKQEWSRDYTGESKQLFSLQREIATDIAAALKTILSPDEIQKIDKRPTENLDAYSYYLQGNNYLSKYKPSYALDMYSKAIQEDSTFTEAYARRARVYLSLYWTRQGIWQNFYLKAQEDIKKGLELDPEMPELRSAQAYAFYVSRDFDKALNILKDLKLEAPKMAELYQTTSDIYRRQGKWEESINERKIAVQLDPFAWTYLTDLASTYGMLHQYDRQIECYKQGSLLIPDMDFNEDLFYALLHKTGDLEAALNNSGAKKEDVQYSVFYYTKQYDKLIELIRNGNSVNSGLTDYQPKAFRIALIYYLCGNKSLCKIYSDSAVVFLKTRIKETPDDERLNATLGKAYALLGNVNEAIKYGKKAVELMPIKLDAFQSSYMEMDFMEIYIFTKNYDMSIEKMEYLLSIPSPLHIGDILINPIYDNLRSVPRFQKIIENARKQIL
jgi:TolB-like protein/Flp pilus assembly protein TadD